MDYQKLDAALAGELGRASRETAHAVFIHAAAPLNAGQAAELAAIGVKTEPGGRIFTATVPVERVDKISELPWIAQISLAKKRRPL